MRALIEKTNESLSSVIPITAIVLLLSISIAPLTPGALILFLFGAVLLVAGMFSGFPIFQCPRESGAVFPLFRGSGRFPLRRRV